MAAAPAATTAMTEASMTIPMSVTVMMIPMMEAIPMPVAVRIMAVPRIEVVIAVISGRIFAVNPAVCASIRNGNFTTAN